MTPAAYGATLAAISSMPIAAIFSHAVASSSPIKGRSAAASATDGIFRSAADLAQSAMTSTWSTIVPIVSNRGTTRTESNTSVITVTASARFPQRRASTVAMTGHVDTTMVAAHTIAPINGIRIHIDDPINVKIKITFSSTRVMSGFGSAMGKSFQMQVAAYAR